eukprot:3772985-Rhodomonas_salina.1
MPVRCVRAGPCASAWRETRMLFSDYVCRASNVCCKAPTLVRTISTRSHAAAGPRPGTGCYAESRKRSEGGKGGSERVSGVGKGRRAGDERASG